MSTAFQNDCLTNIFSLRHAYILNLSHNSILRNLFYFILFETVGWLLSEHGGVSMLYFGRKKVAMSTTKYRRRINLALHTLFQRCVNVDQSTLYKRCYFESTLILLYLNSHTIYYT